MGVKGKLTKDKMGWAIPVDAPAYGPPPGYFKQARFIRFDYETDAESASEIIPEQLTLTDPATAAVMFVEYPWSTAGYYREAFLGVNVTYNDEKLFYACYLMCCCTCCCAGLKLTKAMPRPGDLVPVLLCSSHRCG